MCGEFDSLQLAPPGNASAFQAEAENQSIERISID
jgi:hypothetical protein